MKDKVKEKAHHYSVKIMGCGFVITAVHSNPSIAWKAIRAAEAEMNRIEDLISSWKEDSQTSRINEAAGKGPVEVDDELFQLIKRSKKVSQLTQGAFDISGTLARYYWNFNQEENIILPMSKIKELTRLINFRNIDTSDSEKTVYLRNEGMKIGFGGIGKGYAAERAKRVMQDLGVESGLVNASGDLVFWGKPPNKDRWDIHIPDPRDRTLNLLSLALESGAVVTSGSYENYTIIDGKRYSHIINPRTGMPVTHTKNVTVICPNAEVGDALATALSVLPIEEGINLINRLAGIEAIIVDQNDQLHFTNTLKMQAYA